MKPVRYLRNWLLLFSSIFLMSGLNIAAGAVLLFSGVAFPQPIFAPPQNLGPKINSSFYDSDPFLTYDGKKLFFVSTRDGAEDIWYSDWTGTAWTNAIKLGSQINYSIFLQHSPSVSPDGQRLYYVDASRGGNWHIWVATWDSSINDWGTPTKIPYPVSTSGSEGEFSARIAPDGLHLYFTSVGGPEARCGLYVSEWDGTSWSVPVLVLECDTEEYPSITADGRWLYFRKWTNVPHVHVSEEGGGGWSPAVNIDSQLVGENGTTDAPFITPTGDTLFFSTPSLSGVGARDIWMSERVVRGDLNMDRQITAADVVLELNKVFLDESFPAPAAVADVNCDGLFTSSDVVLHLNRTFLGIPFPCF